MASRGSGKPDKAIRVLLVDDSRLTLAMYDHYLRFAGLHVRRARDGHEAIEKATQDPPDLIVMDISMPLMEGDEAAAVLKNDVRTRHVPIIALTAFGGLARSKGRSGVFDGFYHKPLLPQALARLIRSHVARSRERIGESSRT